MTTEKTIKKYYEFMSTAKNVDFESMNDSDFFELVAKCFYPRLAKNDLNKAIAHTRLDLETCAQLNYLEIDDEAESLEECITITEKGAARVEKKSDFWHRTRISFACFIGGALFTGLINILIELVKLKG